MKKLPEITESKIEENGILVHSIKNGDGTFHVKLKIPRLGVNCENSNFKSYINNHMGDVTKVTEWIHVMFKILVYKRNKIYKDKKMIESLLRLY